jgi:hypothetical protein
MLPLKELLWLARGDTQNYCQMLARSQGATAEQGYKNKKHTEMLLKKNTQMLARRCLGKKKQMLLVGGGGGMGLYTYLAVLWCSVT